MTDIERIKLLEETVLIMSKCLDRTRVQTLNEIQSDTLFRNIARLNAISESEDK